MDINRIFFYDLLSTFFLPNVLNKKKVQQQSTIAGSLFDNKMPI